MEIVIEVTHSYHNWNDRCHVTAVRPINACPIPSIVSRDTSELRHNKYNPFLTQLFISMLLGQVKCVCLFYCLWYCFILVSRIRMVGQFIWFDFDFFFHFWTSRFCYGSLLFLLLYECFNNLFINRYKSGLTISRENITSHVISCWMDAYVWALWWTEAYCLWLDK